MSEVSRQGIVRTGSDSTVSGDMIAAWIFLAAFVVAVWWADGLTGWPIASVWVGALVGAVAASRRMRFRETLWLLSGFFMGAPVIAVVFKRGLGAHDGLGLALLVALLIFDVAEMSARGQVTGPTSAGRLP